MNIPQLDGRNSDDIKQNIFELAKSFAPEWRFDEKNVDAGSTVALIYAEMVNDTIKNINRTAEKNVTQFFSQLGAEFLYAEASHSFVTFTVSGEEGNVEGEYCEAGQTVSAETDVGGTTVFTVKEPVYALNSHISDIFYLDGENDCVIQKYSYSQKNKLPFYINSDEKGENLQKHMAYFTVDDCVCEDTEAEIKLDFEFDNADAVSIKNFLDTICISGTTAIYYSSENGMVRVKEPIHNENGIVFKTLSGKPFVKTEIDGQTACFIKLEFSDCLATDNLYVKNIGAMSVSEKCAVDELFNELSELDSNRCYPFGETPVPYTSVYFSSDKILGRKNSEINLQFRVSYERRAISEVESNDIDWKYIMKKSQLKKPTEYDVKVKNVLWEYYNGSGWVRLFKDNSYNEIFSGENDGEKETISFICPKDIEKAFLPSGECYCIRARIISVENFAKLYGYYVLPIISETYISYKYDRPVKSNLIITDSCLEKKYYDKTKSSQSARLTACFDNDEKSLYFVFSVAPQMADTKILFVVPKGLKKSETVWEFYSKKGWVQLNCIDETGGLSRTGLLTLGDNAEFSELVRFGVNGYWIRAKRLSADGGFKISKICLNSTKVQNIEYKDEESFYVDASTSKTCRLTSTGIISAEVMVDEFSDVSSITAAQLIREKKADGRFDNGGKLYQLWVKWEEVSDFSDVQGEERVFCLDREKSEIHFGDGLNGKTPPKSESENVRIKCVTGGGKAGNMPIGRINGLNDVSGMISSVTNYIEASGGQDRENIDQTIERSAAGLRTGARSVTAFDFRHVVLSCERDILSVKCISGKNADGETEYGGVTVIILARESSDFTLIADKAKNEILKVCPANLRSEKLHIVSPSSVIYKVMCRVAAESFEKSREKAEDIKTALYEYFKKTDEGGRYDEKYIGFLPGKNDILSVVANAASPYTVNEFYVIAENEKGDEVTQNELSLLRKKGMCISVLGGTDIRTEKI